jgi:hypothetical protein
MVDGKFSQEFIEAAKKELYLGDDARVADGVFLIPHSNGHIAIIKEADTPEHAVLGMFEYAKLFMVEMFDEYKGFNDNAGKE